MKTTDQVITAFSAAKKEHWRSPKRHGSKTACHRKTSGIGANENERFATYVNKYPEICCSVCMAKYKEYRG